jgi:hypothetical protein
LTGVLPFLLAAPAVVLAEPTPSSQAEANAASNPAAAFTPQQLDQMSAPIVLYPDQLLTELLMAATFPQQIIDAGAMAPGPKQCGADGRRSRRRVAAPGMGSQRQVSGRFSADHRDDEQSFRFNRPSDGCRQSGSAVQDGGLDQQKPA